MAEVGNGDKEEAEAEEADTEEPEPLISPPQLIPNPPPHSLATRPSLDMTAPATCAPHDTILGRVGTTRLRLIFTCPPAVGTL
jgi:hypothetical protein